jgi:hypothetical protein
MIYQFSTLAKVAGAVGFEPTDSFYTISSFQDWRHKPLDQTPIENLAYMNGEQAPVEFSTHAVIQQTFC